VLTFDRLLGRILKIVRHVTADFDVTSNLFAICSNRLQIFSRSQKGFVQGQAGYMEHAVPTREMICQASPHRNDMYMVQIDFSNAFGSVPHELILSNMYTLGLPIATVELVRDIYTDNRSKITWQSGTVHGFPLSPTLFNICLEGFLRRLEKDDMKQLGYIMSLEDGTVIQINTAAYADDLIPLSERHQDMEIILN
jgi:hypothetical protein